MLLGARQFFERRGAPTPPLPYDAEVEWLYRQGPFDSHVNVPYIDVGISAGLDVGVDISARDATLSTSGVNNATMITGSFVGPGSGYWGVYSYNGDNYRLWGNASKTIGINSSIFYTYHYNFLNSRRFVIVHDGRQEYVGELYGAPTFSNGNVWLGLINKGGYSQYEAGALYISNAKYSVGENIVRDFVPVRFTNEQGVSEGAMYDRVSGQLFRNAGTGAFTIGPDK